jgi:MFS family permease
MPGSATTRGSELKGAQLRAGLAAWLGWFFDGLDMHLYTLVALPFVAELMGLAAGSQAVRERSSWIQAAFLLGWALGGGLFGFLGDRLGRSRALVLTILTYSCFTGLSYIATSWQELALFRFLAALGIGGEWAVGASLLAETWPRRWRPLLAAVLQSAVNLGVIAATVASFLLADCPNRVVFLVGLAPALVTLWIRRRVPESAEWRLARSGLQGVQPGLRALFAPGCARISWLTMACCALSLSGHWAFMFWALQQLRGLAELHAWSDSDRNRLASEVMLLLSVSAVVGNLLAALLAHRLGYRRTMVLMFLAYAVVMWSCYLVPRPLRGLLPFLVGIGLCQGVFALFTMYLPPLFPTLLRTTGAGFCYNIGRIAAAIGTVVFGLVAPIGDVRYALVAAAVLFLPAALVAWFLPELPTVDAGPDAPALASTAEPAAEAARPAGEPH